MTTRHTTPALLIILASLAGGAMAAGNVDGMIKYRQNVMTALGGHVGAIDRILRGQVPMRDQLKLHSEAAAKIATTIPTLFPLNTVPPEMEFAGATVETKAKAAIADKPEDFKKAAKEAETATADFLKVVDSGGDEAALAKSFKAVGMACKGCHTDFRKKED
jgi:cytochrome c556